MYNGIPQTILHQLASLIFQRIVWLYLSRASLAPSSLILTKLIQLWPTVSGKSLEKCPLGGNTYLDLFLSLNLHCLYASLVTLFFSKEVASMLQSINKRYLSFGQFGKSRTPPIYTRKQKSSVFLIEVCSMASFGS